MAKAMPSAAAAAQAWQQGFSAAGPKWTAGIDSVTTPPGQLAVAAQARYVAGVQNNVNKWAARTGAVSLQQWKDASKTKGAQRLATGAQVGMAKYQARIAEVLSAEASIIAGLPARGDIMANIARSSQFQLQLHQAFNSGA